MVKLIRLTSEDDCKFNANMDSDIVVGENAQIAVKNLTFETIFQTLSITGTDRVVSFNFDSNAYGITHDEELKLVDYTSANYDDFFEDLEGTLNSTCSLGSAALGGIPGDTAPMNNYMQFHITADEEKKKIQFRLTPMLHPLLETRAFNYEYAASDPNSGYDRTNLIFTSQPAGYSDVQAVPPAVTTAGVWLRAYNQAGPDYEAIDYGIVQREEGTRSTLLNRYIHPAVGVEWCKGNAVWWCRVHLLTSASGNKDAHGFAIGLSKTQIPGDPELANSHRDYEIRIHDTSHNVFYIDPTTANTLTDGGVGTFKVTATNEDQNDIMMIRKDRNIIKGLYITGDGGGTTTELFSYTIPASEKNIPLYPYAYWCGAGDEDQMGQPSMTLDPFIIDTTTPNGYLDFMKPGDGDVYGDFTPGEPDSDGYERASAVLETQLPQLDPDYWKGILVNPSQVTDVSIAKDILRFMGFSGPKYNGSGRHTFNPPFNSGEFGGTFGFELIPENIFQITNSDNYVVVIDSLPVLSYDGSFTQGLLANNTTVAKTGRRYNILATIPVNDNSGFVQFDSNEVVYIDLDNSFKQNISNLRLRVLDKSLNQINTQGISVMTLLLKDGN